MKIGIDLNCWTNRRGYGRYTRELLRELLRIDSRNTYYLFLSRHTAEQSADLPTFGRCQYVLVDTDQSPTEAASAAGNRSIRDMWAMGQAVRRHSDLDLFFFPSVYTFFPLWTRSKIIVTIHDTIAERHPQLIFPNRRARLFWNLKVRCAIWQSDLITTVSESARRALVNHFRLAERSIRVIPDAVGEAFRVVDDPAETARVLARHGVEPASRYILYVGGISPHKNLLTLLTAFGQVTNDASASRVQLVLAGDFQKDGFFSSYAAVRARIDELGLAGRVVLPGYVPDADLVYLYNAASVFVLPSVDEGFGLPCLEAMACGAPVVASRAGALPEVVGPGGRLFNPDSPVELARHLRELLEDEGQRAALARQALRRARDFSWQHSARAALTVFEDVANSPQ